MATIGWTVKDWVTRQRETTSETGLQTLISLVQNLERDPAWITIATAQDIRTQWEEFQLLKTAKKLPLYGVPFAVKDNIDAKPFPTTAACPAYKYTPSEDSTVVQLLKQAGGIVIGKTNLDQFATGLVGTRSPYEIPTSTFSTKHISGGSSSGSACVTSRGIVPFALGTDTAGSGRIPAQFNNVIGVKPSRGIVSCTGVIPACRTIDCVSIFTLSLSDAALVLKIVAKYDEIDSYARIYRPVAKKLRRFGIPTNPRWFDDTFNQVVFEKTLERFIQIGIDLVKIDFSLMYELGALLYEGPWVAERNTVIKNVTPEDLDPTVRTIVGNADKFTATDYFEYEYKRMDLVRKIRNQIKDLDGLIVPTAPMNPTIDQLLKDPITVNSNLGTYTNFVNFSDMSGLSIPAGFREDNLPFGVTLLSDTFHDNSLLKVAELFLSPNRRLGATQVNSFQHDNLQDCIQLAVFGAHLSGLPLNYELVEIGATLVTEGITSAKYRLFAMQGGKKPGLQRVNEGGKAIKLELWDVPIEEFGKFMLGIPHPLGIGTVELSDGSWVKGFVCEQAGLVNAVDVSDFGGWRAYLESKK